MRVFLLFITSALLFSCSASFHCKKCFSKADIKSDTVYLDSVIYTPVTKSDTVIVFDLSTDTLFLTTPERIKIKFRDIPGPTIYISAECPKDSVIVRVPTLVTNEIKTGYTWLHLLGAILIGAGVVSILFILKR